MVQDSKIIGMSKYIVFVLYLTLSFSLKTVVAEPLEISFKQIDDPGNSPIQLSHWRYNSGDQAGWSSMRIDDKHWKLIDFESKAFKEIKPYKNYWLRKSIVVNESLLLSLHYANLRSASEFYWDGELLHSAGKVGSTKEQEQPGNLSNIVNIPTHLLQPGKHLIAIRVSNHHNRNTQDNLSVSTGFYNNFLEPRHLAKNVASFIAGIFLTAALFLSLFFVSFNRKSAYL